MFKKEFLEINSNCKLNCRSIKLKLIDLYRNEKLDRE